MGIPKEAIFGALALATLVGSGGTAAPVIAAAAPAVVGAAAPAAATAAGIGTTALGAEAAGTTIGSGILGGGTFTAPAAIGTGSIAGSGALGAGASLAPAAQSLGAGVSSFAPAAGQTFGGLTAGLEAGLPAVSAPIYSAAGPSAVAGGLPTEGAAGLNFDDIQKYMKLAQAGSQVGGAMSPGAAPPPARRAPVQHQAPNIDIMALMNSARGTGPLY